MTKEQNEIIEKLEELVLEIHRNAGWLDRDLRSLRHDLENETFIKTEKATIINTANHRESFKTLLDYDDLDEREAELWEELKATCKEGS